MIEIVSREMRNTKTHLVSLLTHANVIEVITVQVRSPLGCGVLFDSA
jgi:hypothetical protein